MILPITGDVAPQEVFPPAKTAIAQALQLEPDSAEAHTSDATTKFFECDFKGAEAAARRAIKLNENYSLAHLFLAHVLSNVGRHDEALAVSQQALVLDPFSLITGAMHGQFLYQAGKDSESVERLKATLEMESRFWVGQICLAKTYVPPYNLALVFAGLRESETALNWLERAFEERDVHMPFLLDHKWDRMRSNAQFQKLLSRVGFASSQRGV
jgi:tetratricopeptide (TPR) repeat protein